MFYEREIAGWENGDRGDVIRRSPEEPQNWNTPRILVPVWPTRRGISGDLLMTKNPSWCLYR